MRGLLVVALCLGVSLVVTGCGGEHRLTGQVVDFDTGTPLAGVELVARQSGWGFSGGSLVWDKSYLYRVFSDAQGRFDLRYRHGASAHLWIEADGYQRLELWSDPGEALKVPLKRRVSEFAPLTSGFLGFGLGRDGHYYGWDFAACRQVTDPEGADLIPTAMGSGRRAPVELATGGRGGVMCRSLSELGVPGQPLTYSDEAPVEGYQPRVVLDFAEDEGGVCFVRTRDGEHYAKFAYTPESFAARAHPEIERDVLLRYVFNPSGSRNLHFQEEAPNLSCGDPWSWP